MTSVTDEFRKAGLIPWWNASVTQFFNGVGEKGTDYGLGSFKQPVGSISGGRVVYVGDGGYPGSSIGKIVQVLMPDGRLVHYQHLYDSSVVTGQVIQPGTVIGHGGGCPTGGYPANNVGNACTFTDQYSTGQHIEVRLSTSYNPAGGVWSQNWINPLGAFQQLGNAAYGGPLPPVATGTSGSVASGGAIVAPVPANTFFTDIGQKIGLMLLALTFVGVGFYLLFSQQINNAVGNIKNTAEKAAEIGASV